jgi:hypothetical protein
MDTPGRLRSTVGFSSHRMQGWFGVKSDYTGFKRIRSNPLEPFGIPRGMMHSHMEVAA